MIRVLFVDDEIKILDGLRRMLRKMRNEWDMHFANSGPEAIQILGQQEFDVIVSDNCMPQMAGADLLETVRQQYPKMARFILSGHSGRELTMRSVAPAHRFLSKPCEPEQLIGAVNRSISLRTLAKHERIATIVSQADALPALPSTYEALVNAMNDSEFPLDRLAEIIEKDVGVTAKLLQVVNSAFFGMAKHIDTPVEAVKYLGLDTVRGLVLGAGVFSAFPEPVVRQFSINTIEQHSVRVGVLARQIMGTVEKNPRTMEEAFTAGLLHDVGKLMMIVAFRDNDKPLVETLKAQGSECLDMERRHYQITHGELGGFLLGLWGLPDAIVEAVTYHEVPGECHATEFGPLAAVHIADRIDNFSLRSPEAFESALDNSIASDTDIMNQMPEWQRIAQEAYERREEPAHA